MRRTIVASVLGITLSVASVASLHGQGVISFSNYISANYTQVAWGAAHPEGYNTGDPVSDTSVVVGLYAGPGVLTDSTALQLLATTAIFTVPEYGGGWYWCLPDTIIPSSIWPGPGSTVTFQVRGWGGQLNVTGASVLWQETRSIAPINEPANGFFNGPMPLTLFSISNAVSCTLQTSVVGSGTISLNPAGNVYVSNTVVVLTANPVSGWAFDHWSGDVTGNANPVSVTMSGPRSVQAVFVLLPVYTLETSAVGSGTISVNPGGGSYPSNTVVALTAHPATGWAFDHWSGDLTGNANPVSLTMNGPRSVQAVFAW